MNIVVLIEGGERGKPKENYRETIPAGAPWVYNLQFI